MTRKKKRHTGMRAYSSRAELKYVGIRALHSDSLYLDATFDKMLKMALLEEYRNEPETNATLKITGYLDAFDKNIKWMATRSDMVRYFKIAEQARWNTKFALTKEEAVARFFSGKQPRKIANLRPFYFRAKADTPYTPRRGSSLGKTSTRQIGARRVERDFRKLIETIFSLSDAFGKKRAKTPKVNVTRTFTKTFK